jgi:hypothetical protein
MCSLASFTSVTILSDPVLVTATLVVLREVSQSSRAPHAPRSSGALAIVADAGQDGWIRFFFCSLKIETAPTRVVASQ